MPFLLPLLAMLLATASNWLHAQVITANPPFPNANQSVTITFDATQGNGGLANCSCDVYIHTGVITAASTNPSDWKYVTTTWGQANAAWRLTPVPGQPNKYTFSIGPSIRQYYNVPAGEEILRLAMVFRNATGSLEGKGTGNTDIFYDVYPENIPLTTTLTSPSESQLEVAIGQFINVSGAANVAANLALYEDGELLTSQNNTTTLTYNLRALEPGTHEVYLVAVNGTESDTSRFRYTADYRVVLTAPAQPVVLTSAGAGISVQANAYINSNLQLFVDGALFQQANNAETISANITAAPSGVHEVLVTAEYNGLRDTTGFVYVIPGNITPLDPPAGFNDGITYLPDGRVYLQLYAPNKQVVFAIGDFNDWRPSLTHQLNRSVDGHTWWIYLEGLQPGQQYGLQYLVDANLRIADPYSTLVLDRFNDPFIDEVTFPDLHPYPVGKTTGIVTLLQPGAAPYNWQVDNFIPPPKNKLTVYELLVRDFVDSHNYLTVIDSLDYLQNLGITAIELMPVNEFEGNISWGYNPSYHMALDKYYGTPAHFKQFVDACHARGIAVIVDVVYNHAFSQSPLAQLYWDASNNRPTPDNPWLNVEARHPFNVGYDFNHESLATRRFVDQVMTFWLTEYRVDGFRFDLSKGFTQRQSNNVGAWNQYDAERIAIIKHYADVVWAANPNAYVILEHFAENSEETELQAYGNGMMFWTGGGLHNAYLDAAAGFSANLIGTSYTSRGWDEPNLVAYMESHDEERMVVKNLRDGNAGASYNIREILTALRRVELASVLFYAFPGAKMLWQFGEVGYDFSINYCEDGSINEGCRTGPKPIRWEYFDSPNRRRIYDVMRAMLDLRQNLETFSTSNFNISTGGFVKRVSLFHPTMDAVVLGNFNVVSAQAVNPFFYGGWWYEYFTGDSLQVINPATPLTLAPGEYRLYTSERLNAPPGGYLSSTGDLEEADYGLNLAPNPVSGWLTLRYRLPRTTQVHIQVLNLQGQRVATLQQATLPAGDHLLQTFVDLPAGMYLVLLQTPEGIQVSQLVTQ